MKIAGPTDATDLGIATVYQDLALCDNLDVVENLFLGQETVGDGPATLVMDETSMEKRTGELLQRLAVTITSVRAEVGTMSGGSAQVAIARSLLGEPKLVMLDEPTARSGSPDGDGAGLIKRLREEGQAAVVVISHNLADVFEVADRIFVLRLGRRRATSRWATRARRRSWRRSPGRSSGTVEEQKGDPAMSAEEAVPPPRRPISRSSPRESRNDILRRFVQGDLAELRVVLVLAVIWAIFYPRRSASSARST